MLSAMHSLFWLIHGSDDPKQRLGRLRRARRLIAERLADAGMTVEGLRADLRRLDDALESCMLSGKQEDRHG